MLSGFAVRANGSCLSTEVDCGQTMKPYHACCPAGSYCPAQYNVACCPSSANCTETLLQSPSCANTTWNLYDNEGYFCCEPGKIGYASPKSFSDGCADPGVPPDGAVLLSVVSVGQGMMNHLPHTCITCFGLSKAKIFLRFHSCYPFVCLQRCPKY